MSERWLFLVLFGKAASPVPRDQRDRTRTPSQQGGRAALPQTPCPALPRRPLGRAADADRGGHGADSSRSACCPGALAGPGPLGDHLAVI